MNQNTSRMNSSSREMIDIDSIKMFLKNIPFSRTNCYFETKNLTGFKENLHEEIQDLLIELQSAEDNIQNINKIFILFLDQYERQMNDKDEQISNLSIENERLMMKLSMSKNNQEPLQQEIFNLEERNSKLKQEMDIIEAQCEKYEDIIHELMAKHSNTVQQEISTLDLKKEFIKHYEKIKEELPNYFCLCLGNYEQIKQEKCDLRGKIAELRSENEELQQNLAQTKNRIENFEHHDKHISYENQRLKADITKIQKIKGSLLNAREDEKKHFSLLKVKSLSPNRTPKEENLPKRKFKNKHNRLLKKKTNDKTQQIEEMRELVRRRSRAISFRYSSLLSEMEKALETNNKTALDTNNLFNFDVKECESGESQTNLSEMKNDDDDLNKKNKRISKLYSEDSNNYKAPLCANNMLNFDVIESKLSQTNLPEIKKEDDDINKKNKRVSKLCSEKNNSPHTRISRFLSEKNIPKKEDTNIVEQGSQGNITRISMKNSCFLQGNSGEYFESSKFSPRKRNVAKVWEINFFQIIVFLQLIIFNMIRKVSVWIIESKSSKNNGFFGSLFEKTKVIIILINKFTMISWGFLILMEISAVGNITKKIKRIFNV